MSFDCHFLILAALVALSFTTEAATGFGSVIIAMTLAVHLYPIRTLVPLLVLLNIVLTSYIVARHRDHIAFGLLLRRVLPLMGIGLAGGLVIFERATSGSLRFSFGIFVVAVAARELHTLLMGDGSTREPLPAAVASGGIFAAGVVHGVFATGGPLLVYVLGRSGLSKGGFRSTLATVWLLLNLVLATFYIYSGRGGSGLLPFFAALLPVVAVSIVAGEWVHGRLDEHRFRVAVFALLLLAGASLLV